MRTYAINGASIAPEPKSPTQDVNRHKARAAANHLSPAELTKRDAGAVLEDAAALNQVWASRPLKPPGRRA